MNVPPVSVERVQKCVVNFEIYRFLKKSGQFTPSSPTYIIAVHIKMNKFFAVKDFAQKQFFLIQWPLVA